MSTDSLEDTDDFADLYFDPADEADTDEFADLDEFAEPEPEFVYVPVNLNETEDYEPEPEPEPVSKPDKNAPPRPIMSGHCSWPQTRDPHLSHARCARMGSGMDANPQRRFHPCPCACHFPGEHYECECGGTIVVAPYLGYDEDGDDQYVHIDHKGRMTKVNCR